MLPTLDNMPSISAPTDRHLGFARHSLVSPGTIPRLASFLLTALLCSYRQICRAPCSYLRLSLSSGDDQKLWYSCDQCCKMGWLGRFYIFSGTESVCHSLGPSFRQNWTKADYIDRLGECDVLFPNLGHIKKPCTSFHITIPHGLV